jgi:hypothetical protein
VPTFGGGKCKKIPTFLKNVAIFCKMLTKKVNETNIFLKMYFLKCWNILLSKNHEVGGWENKKYTFKWALVGSTSYFVHLP